MIQLCHIQCTVSNKLLVINEFKLHFADQIVIKIFCVTVCKTDILNFYEYFAIFFFHSILSKANSMELVNKERRYERIRDGTILVIWYGCSM